MTRSAVVSHARLLAVAAAALLVAGLAWQAANPPNRAHHAQAATGVQIQMVVTGQKQGVFKGDDNSSSRTKGLQTVLAYQFELVAPRDNASGQASGKRQFKPVVVTHRLGGSSPQFLAAAATNENLTSMLIEFVETDQRGEAFVFYTVPSTTHR